VKTALHLCALLFLITSCGEGSNRVGGAFSPINPNRPQNTGAQISGDLYIEADSVAALETMERTRRSTQTQCNRFRSPVFNDSSFVLNGLSLDSFSTFKEVQGLRTGVAASNKVVARLYSNTFFEYVDPRYMQLENPFGDLLTVEFYADRMEISLANSRGSRTFGSPLFWKVTPEEFEDFNKILSRSCR